MLPFAALPLLVLFSLSLARSGNCACTLSGQLANASIPLLEGWLLPIPPRCSLLGQDEVPPFIVQSTLTLRGDASGAGSLDLQYATGAVLTAAPGAQIVIDTLRIYNVRLDPTSFLALSAFRGIKLRLSSVDIVTDCLTLSAVATSGNVSAFAQGPGYMYVSRYASADINATAVNITCRMPAVERSADGDVVGVYDSEELYNVLFANQSNGAPLTVMAMANLTLAPELWQQPRPLVLTRNVSLRGDPGVLNVLDLTAIVAAVELPPGIVFELSNFCIVNVGPLRGKLVNLGMLPLFSLPVWFFNFTRTPDVPQLRFTNVTVTVPLSEYQYFMLWTVVVTTEVTQVSEAAKLLRATTSVIKLGVAPNRDTIAFARLCGTGVDLYNGSLTAVLPGGPFTNRVLDNPNLQFSLDVAPNLNQLPVYTLADMVAVLQAMQDTQPLIGSALFILRNITIDPAVWPANGFNLTAPLLMVGQSNMGTPTWINFHRMPNFVRAFGCPPSMYIFIQGLYLLNLPNAMALPRGAPDGGAPAGAAERAGLSDVSIYMSNFAAANTSCPAPMTYTNQSAIVVTYSEYKRVYAAVAKSFGTTRDGVGNAVGWNFTYSLFSVVLDNIRFSSVVGWGWSGYRVNITYIFPANVPVMYTNVYDPPAPPPGPGLVLVPAPGGGDGLSGWHVALIVLGAVALVALASGLVAWRIVSRLRQEVDAVKSGSSDKHHSSSRSGDADATNGNGMGGRLGSSGNRGGELAPAAVKGSLGGGGSGGGGAGGTDGDVGTPKGSGGRGTSDGFNSVANADKPPLEVLNSMMATLTREMNDQHLTILEVIGQGGFGVVYKGLWKGLNVAVKTITFQDRVAGGEKAQHRAILEAAISSSLAHPNVVTTFSYDIKPLTVQDNSSSESPSPGGTGTNTPGGNGGLKIVDKRTVLDWKLYLIQEYCDGGSLRTAILKRKFFDAKRNELRMEMLLDTALELAGGLVHLHERNIIHGDLNPNNVLLKRDPTRKYGAVCKIADFGLSIKMNADQSHISNMRRGTPFYTCPQILSRGNMTKAADVYSMGVMMWEMYHCCMSYRSLPSGFAARENFPHFPRKAPHDFAQLVASCLDPEPAARPTFVQLRSMLEAQLAALKRGELRSGEAVLGPDPAGDAAHLAACQD